MNNNIIKYNYSNGWLLLTCYIMWSLCTRFNFHLVTKLAVASRVMQVLLYTGCLLNAFSWGGGGDFRWLLTAGGCYENMIYSCTNKRFGLIFQFVYTFLVLDSFTVEN